ncbi:hypothetical protein LX15_003537 [Streptoalloteichus tenebrarius]|uniref:Uncharacterized protein n=1 Tax=Streptoalloteichus tenebrarius (strain ATCC 17920 / DSM 40477 / JCM 4838 / CBS 697.72 / NBRC 16177 / NCIMB 11028 / NRRL B-12390 / A12253. 1 / ISP 5477) TaxID=1933 RepID=A0ABT1HWC8_STRSD|nr:hypothetical protein [Streptoalloteichus tenebrarius]MCP2259828.1 hypothetical protein [Streptoalloteichus tenebrarius]BFE99222.1 hypothetical protein GCM10020241_08980 [Streptoalloteichus tenebrarius]
MHEALFAPNEGRPGRGLRLRPGLALALAPRFVRGGKGECCRDEDGWTLRTVDGSWAAHVERTMTIAEEERIVLTAP